jgi:MFS family permease
MRREADDVVAGGTPAESGSADGGSLGRQVADTGAVSTFAALRVRNYRLFFSGQVVSNTGTWMQRIAQDWLVLSITNSPIAVGVTTALQFLPMLLFGLWGGVIADRYPKRTMLIATQSVMAVLAAILAVLTLTGHVQVWHVYVVAFALGLVSVVDTPTRQTFVNEMVPPRLVRNAVSLNSGNFQLARMVGPAVAGVLISAVGSGWAFAFNAISYLAVIAGLVLMRTADLQVLERAPRRRGQVREGLRYVRERPTLLWIMVLMFFVGTFGYNFAIFLSAYAKNVFHSGADVFGLLNTALAVGSVVGALFAARRATARLGFLFSAAGGFSALLVLAGLTPWLGPFAVVLVGIGWMSVTFSATANATAQLSTEAAMRGRVMSLYMLVFAGGTPIGSPIVGAITEHWGAPVAIAISGAICLLATAGCAVLAARQSGVRVRVDLHRGAQQRLVMLRHGAPSHPISGRSAFPGVRR